MVALVLIKLTADAKMKTRFANVQVVTREFIAKNSVSKTLKFITSSKDMTLICL